MPSFRPHPYKFINVSDLAIPSNNFGPTYTSTFNSTCFKYSNYQSCVDTNNPNLVGNVNMDQNASAPKMQLKEVDVHPVGQKVSTEESLNKSLESIIHEQKHKPVEQSSFEMVASSFNTATVDKLAEDHFQAPRTYRELGLSLNSNLPETGDVCVLCEKPEARAQCILD